MHLKSLFRFKVSFINNKHFFICFQYYIYIVDLQCNDVPRRKNESANKAVQTEDHESTNKTVLTNHQNDSANSIFQTEDHESTNKTVLTNHQTASDSMRE